MFEGDEDDVSRDGDEGGDGGGGGSNKEWRSGSCGCVRQMSTVRDVVVW